MLFIQNKQIFFVSIIGSKSVHNEEFSKITKFRNQQANKHHHHEKNKCIVLKMKYDKVIVKFGDSIPFFIMP